MEYIGHDVLFGYFPAYPDDIPDFRERISDECSAAQTAYIAELPPGYGVAALSPGPELFDPALEFTAKCTVGPKGDEASDVVGSVRD